LSQPFAESGAACNATTNESGRGLPHSKTLARVVNAIYAFYAINEINALYAFYEMNEFNEFYAINAVRFGGEMIEVGHEREERTGLLGNVGAGAP
jgi:hypothetical protein